MTYAISYFMLDSVKCVCMCLKVAELEAHGGHGPSDLLKDELTQSLEELEALLKAKDEVGALLHLRTTISLNLGDRINRHLMLKLINIIDHFEFDPFSMFQKALDRDMFTSLFT